MAFTPKKKRVTIPNNPEELFRDLRAKTVQGLLSQQADILREYFNHAQSKSDVAIQLPTGSGKTLVGLLIAEWRRIKFKQRVIYLCPTKQLVNQVLNQAIDNYGIEPIAFTGKKSDYLNQNKSRYENCDSVGITTYSSLFNTNPYFDSCGTIIFDDAHAAENYISKFWSLSIERNNEDHNFLYTSLANLIQNEARGIDYSRLFESDENLDIDYQWSDKLPTPIFHKIIPTLVGMIDANTKDLFDLSQKWKTIKENLHACHLFMGSREILIRPLIPPTKKHRPFTSAEQRIYMSATLGNGGDLERITGVKQIYRIKTPEGWDKQVTGRRFFIFPEISMEDSDIDVMIKDSISVAQRALILTPSESNRNYYEKRLKKIGINKIYSPSDIENSKQDFVSSNNSAAILANRYDGIDFPGNDCRILILTGFSKSLNAQEQFISSKLGSQIIYMDRILTRFSQAIGRCTRSSTDYSVVIILSESLNKYLLRPDNRKFLHKEIQSELEFGIEESGELDIKKALENIQSFLKQDKDWKNADDNIVENRETLNQEKIPCINELEKSAQFEIDYINYLWNGDYKNAFEACREILGILSSSELGSYRCLWNYLAGSAYWLGISNNSLPKSDTHVEYFKEAAKFSSGVRWFHSLCSQEFTDKENNDFRIESAQLYLTENLEVIIDKLGTTHNKKFEKKIRELFDQLNSPKFSQFENGLAEFGKLLGYSSERPNKQGAPDAYWYIPNEICFVFEANSETITESTISMKKIRQSISHVNWMRSQTFITENVTIISVLVTNAEKIYSDAIPIANDLKFVSSSQILDLYKKTIEAIRSLRTTYPGEGDLYWRKEVENIYKKERISYNFLIELFSKNQSESLNIIK